MVYLFGLAAVASTYLGGLFALRFRDHLHLILSYSAGAVLGVAFFDLFPESLQLSGEAYGISAVTAVMGVGFLTMMTLNSTLFSGYHEHGNCENPRHTGFVNALSLAAHSVMDGMAIGLAFKVSFQVGIVVTLAVLAHDFSDGINMIGITLRHKGEERIARKWLVVNATAPFVGILLTQLFTLSGERLGMFLAVFAGFFLYIGAAELLPESHHDHSSFWPTVMTVAGMLSLYAVIQLGGF